MLENLFFVAVSKNVFASKTERFARLLIVFGPWCPLLGVRTGKTFSGPKWATNPKKLDFPSLGAVLDETPANQI